jgi:hypothetical protein
MIKMNGNADVNETVTWNIPKYAYKRICSVRLNTQNFSPYVFNIEIAFLYSYWPVF